MTTPPFFGSIRRMLSGTLRGTSLIARADECEKITGACDTRDRVVHRVGRDVREIDEHPEPVHLAHDLLAERVRVRSATGVSVAESAQGMFLEWVSVM